MTTSITHSWSPHDPSKGILKKIRSVLDVTLILYVRGAICKSIKVDTGGKQLH